LPEAAQWVIADNRTASALIGRGDAPFQMIENALDVRLVARGNVVGIHGDPERQEQTRRVLELLQGWALAGEAVHLDTVEAALEAVLAGEDESFQRLVTENLLTTSRGRVIRPKTLGQQQYVQAMRTNSLVFGIGPAGTGKTFLAMAMAVQALKAHQVERLVLTRPAVEAGEKLGFLPGDLQDKVDPYLRPLYDALFEMLGLEAADRLRERGNIEVAPLAYMRGRTLSQSFIILDEAQNTTQEQIKMFLTRIGFGSRVVVNGDVTQMDLPIGVSSGLRQAVSILGGVRDIGVVNLTQRDVVRNPLVAAIVAAYEAHSKELEEGHGKTLG
jgi:phosphate starvation-inducible PhoH-like protein